MDTLIAKQTDPRQGICPRCGVDIEWAYANPERTLVEITCPDCGRYEISRDKFDIEESDIATPDER